MYFKVVSIIASIILVIVSWTLYAIHQLMPNMIFALSSIFVAICILLMNYIIFNKQNTNMEKIVNIIRLVFFGIVIISVVIYIFSSAFMGGHPADDSLASSRYEYYELGKYYLVNQGSFTLVSYSTWIGMKIFMYIVCSLFVLNFIWSFIFIIKRDGIKNFLFGNSIVLENKTISRSIISIVVLILLSSFILVFAFMFLLSL